MNFRTTAAVAVLMAVLGTGTALAQSYGQDYPPPSSQQGHYASQQGPYTSQQAPYAGHQGMRALISEEVRAGRISRGEGRMLKQRIREMRAEHRGMRQGTGEGRQAYYGGHG